MWRVTFAEIGVQTDEGYSIETLTDGSNFTHDFLIEKIALVDHDDTNIVYRLSLVSFNKLDGIKILHYSNYNTEPVSIFDILKENIINAGLKVDDDSWDMTTTDVKINYITNGNDNLETIQKYLLNKLYYYETKEKSMKFMMYNELKNKYFLYNIKEPNTALGQYAVILSFGNSHNESLLYEDENKLATITKLPFSETLQMMYNKHIYGFNYQTNQFTDLSVSSDESINYFNSRANGEGLVNKFFNFDDTVQEAYTSRTAYWNNDLRYYNDTMDIMLKSNALVIDTTGEITRHAGSLINIAVDTDANNAEPTTGDDLKEMAQRYKRFDGTYVASKVHHYIQFVDQLKPLYRQTLTLVRNYTMDLEGEV